MADAIELYLQIEVQQSCGKTTARMTQLAAPVKRPRSYSVRCLSRLHIVIYLYWLPKLPTRAVRDQVLPDLENFVKNIIATDSRLYCTIAPQLYGEDWSFADELSIV